MRNPHRQSGTFIDGVHHIDFPVYYEDTDAGGVVYYANYLRFAERGRTEALHLAGIDHVELMEKYGIWFVARRCVVDYLKPGRLDDILVVRTSIREMRNTSLLMRQEIGRYVFSKSSELSVDSGQWSEENKVEDKKGLSGQQAAPALSGVRQHASPCEAQDAPQRGEQKTPQSGAKQKTPSMLRIEDIAVVDAFMVCVNTAVKPNKIPEPVRGALLARLPVQAEPTS